MILNNLFSIKFANLILSKSVMYVHIFSISISIKTKYEIKRIQSDSLIPSVHVQAKIMWHCFDLSNVVNLVKVLDRDGGVILECLKGDQYVLDQTRNKGHTAQVGENIWWPKMIIIKNICNLLHLADQLRQLASEDQGGVPDVLARRHDAAVEPGGLGQEEQGRDQVQEQEVWTPRHPDLLLLQQGRPPR